MKMNRRIIAYSIYILFGLALCIMGFMEIVDEFWSGMGTAFLAVGVMRSVQVYRFQKNESYREKVEVELTDERNRFLRNKAWAWAGYMFIIISAIAVLVLQILGEEMWSVAASYAVCLILILYWGSYMVLRRKY